MTIIECFECAPIENMVSCLSLNPDRLIFIGDKAIMKRRIELYERFLREKGFETEVILRNVHKYDLNSIIEAFTEIVMTEKECIFDLTGGEDLVLTAAGIVYERYKDEYDIKMQRFNINTGAVQDSDGDGEVLSCEQIAINVKELISLYGGIVAPEEPQPSIAYTASDIEPIWEIVCENPRMWNKAIGAMNEFETHAIPDGDPLEISIDIGSLKEKIMNFSEKYTLYVDMVKRLANIRFIKLIESTTNTISYVYKNALIRRCLEKSGNVLELKTLFEAREFIHKEAPFFNDCLMSVTIDWDGVIHDSDDDKKDTKNEIDVILMHGLIPIFVSCKNGKVGEDELYKLNTVAARFGGKYARKMLIATDLEREGKDSTEFFAQRAKDMDVYLVPDAAKLSKEEWQKEFRKATRC